MGVGQVRFADAAELPVAALGGGEHFLALGGLRAHVGADRRRPLDDVIAQRAEALHLDVDHIARVDRARDGRGAGEQHVAGLQGDRPCDVGDEIVHVPIHLVGVAVLLHLTVDQCADLLVPEVPPLDQPRSDGAQRVGALDPQHRAGVGVAEIVQPVVVTDGVSADVVARLIRGDVARGPPDDDGDLALVVQPLATPRPHDGGLVGVERRDRLVKVRRRRGQAGQHLLDPRRVVQMDADDLGRDDGGKVDRLVDAHLPAVVGNQRVALPDNVDDVAVQQDPARLADGHGCSFGWEVGVWVAQPAAVSSGPAFWRTNSASSGVLLGRGKPPSGRSNQRCTCPVPIEFSYSPYWRDVARQSPSPSAPIIIR